MNNVLASRKIVWPAVAILAVLWFLPTVVHTVHTAMTAGHPAAAVQPSPQPAPETVKPSPAIPVTAEDQQQEEQAKPLMGFWVGQELILDRGICSLMFVAKEDPGKLNHYLGDITEGCYYAPMATGIPKPKNIGQVMAYAYKTSAILSGTAQNGVLHFTADKVIGEKCLPTGFTFTPFAAQLAAEWNDSCGSTHMMLNRKTD
jgi:hypothetical protein